MRCLILCIFLLSTQSGFAQSYSDDIIAYRKQYVKELLEDARSPIKPSQTKFIFFFPPDKKYSIMADFVPSPGVKPFLINTHSGKQKPFKEYGQLKFQIDGKPLVLHVYQMIDYINDAAHKDDLFIPFNDKTNYETTFAGGRYIDLKISDIKDGKLLLDFNKCYNPYCAYADGYSCPIPPKENSLDIEIPVGEKMFQH